MSGQKLIVSARSVLTASALLLFGVGMDTAYGQAAGNRGAASAGHRPTTAQRPTNPGSQSRIPQQAKDRVPQQAVDRAPVLGGTLPEATQANAASADAAQDGLTKATENASDRAKEVAPPLGGSLPESAQEGLAKARENAADQAKENAAPLAEPQAATEETNSEGTSE